jgi:hypothetical protein
MPELDGAVQNQTPWEYRRTRRRLLAAEEVAAPELDGAVQNQTRRQPFERPKKRCGANERGVNK